MDNLTLAFMAGFMVAMAAGGVAYRCCCNLEAQGG